MASVNCVRKTVNTVASCPCHPGICGDVGLDSVRVTLLGTEEETLLACASVLAPRRASSFITGADWLQDPRMFAVPSNCTPCTALPVYRSSLGCHILPSEDHCQPPPRAASPSTLLCSCPSSLWSPLVTQRQGAGSHLPCRGH